MLSKVPCSQPCNANLAREIALSRPTSVTRSDGLTRTNPNASHGCYQQPCGDNIGNGRLGAALAQVLRLSSGRVAVSATVAASVSAWRSTVNNYKPATDWFVSDGHDPKIPQRERMVTHVQYHPTPPNRCKLGRDRGHLLRPLCPCRRPLRGTGPQLPTGAARHRFRTAPWPHPVPGRAVLSASRRQSAWVRPGSPGRVV